MRYRQFVVLQSDCRISKSMNKIHIINGMNQLQVLVQNLIVLVD